MVKHLRIAVTALSLTACVLLIAMSIGESPQGPSASISLPCARLFQVNGYLSNPGRGEAEKQIFLYFRCVVCS